MLEEGATHMVKYEFRNDEPDIIHGRGYVYNRNYHIVWCTKYRNQALARSSKALRPSGFLKSTRKR